jgi:hypothetical protein
MFLQQEGVCCAAVKSILTLNSCRTVGRTAGKTVLKSP